MTTVASGIAITGFARMKACELWINAAISLAPEAATASPVHPSAPDTAATLTWPTNVGWKTELTAAVLPSRGHAKCGGRPAKAHLNHRSSIIRHLLREL